MPAFLLIGKIFSWRAASSEELRLRAAITTAFDPWKFESAQPLLYAQQEISLRRSHTLHPTTELPCVTASIASEEMMCLVLDGFNSLKLTFDLMQSSVWTPTQNILRSHT